MTCEIISPPVPNNTSKIRLNLVSSFICRTSLRLAGVWSTSMICPIFCTRRNGSVTPIEGARSALGANYTNGPEVPWRKAAGIFHTDPLVGNFSA